MGLLRSVSQHGSIISSVKNISELETGICLTKKSAIFAINPCTYNDVGASHSVSIDKTWEEFYIISYNQ